MTESLDPQPVPEVPASSPFALSDTQKYALIGLGGLTVLAVMLSALLRARRARGELVGVVNLPESGPVPSADLVVSIRHLAAAIDSRMQGFQQQLDSLWAVVDAGGGPAVEPSPTVSTFPAGPSGNGSANQTYEGATHDQPENIPPAPAAVSLPPS